MIEYVVNGALICGFGLILLRLLGGASAATRLMVCCWVLGLSLVPWYWLGSWLSLESSAAPTFAIPNTVAINAIEVSALGSTKIIKYLPDYSPYLFLILLLTGLVVFCFVAVNQICKIQSWRRVGRLDSSLLSSLPIELQKNISLWVVPGGNFAAATYSGQGEIWLGEHLLTHSNLTSALTHESVHHNLSHPQIQWLLVLVRCLFWWHPVAWIFINRSRQELELECDEQCAELLGRDRYRRDLAQLLLDVSRVPVGVAFGGGGSFNIRRIKVLKLQQQLTKARSMLATLTVLVTAACFIVVHADQPAAHAQPNKTWSVKMANVAADRVFQQIADLGGISIYVDPSVEMTKLSLELLDVRDWQTVMKVAASTLGLEWRYRGGVVIVGTFSSVKDDAWLPEAMIFRGSGVSVFTPQSTGARSSEETLVRLNILLRVQIFEDDYKTSEMEILIDLNQPAAITSGGKHIFFDGLNSYATGEIVVTLFNMTEIGAMERIGSGNFALRVGGSTKLTWTDADNIIYSLTVSPGEPVQS